LRLGFHLRLDLSFDIEGIADQTLLPRRQVFHSRVTRVGIGVKDGNGALKQVETGGVFEPKAVEGVFSLGTFIVDGHFLSFHVLTDQGKHGGLLAR
jgi:hypothetical protein